jgi:starvation-inducible DNA-binding protein
MDKIMDLTQLLNKVLADTFALYLKTQSFHWNVEGPDFAEYHNLFGDIYEELQAAVDPIAEHVRALDGYAVKRMLELTTVAETVVVPPARDMFHDWMRANDEVLSSIKECYLNAERQGELGLTNFLQDRYDIHKKHAWMVRATLKTRASNE